MNLSKVSTLSAIFAIATAGMGLIGCGASGSAPVISEPTVSCFDDPDYATYAWEFTALVDDADGYEDVTSVSVDVYMVGGTDKLETWNLAYDSNGQWSNVIYESNGSGGVVSENLDCTNQASFEFDFRASDTGGLSDAVTYSFQ